MTSNSVLILGATGTVGRVLVRLLASQGLIVQAATRRPSEMRIAPHESIRAVPFDLEDSSTFGPALAGVGRVFLIARPGDVEPERTALPFISAMERQGVAHVVALTAMGIDRRPDLGLRKVEQALESSGMAFTLLRPNWFMQVFSRPPLVTQILEGHRIVIPAADARISYIDARDVAAVAAAALTDPQHRNRAYTLTGPEAIDHHEVAACIGEATGAAIEYRPSSEPETRILLEQAGFPPAWIERLLTFYRLVRAGFCAPVDTSVERILGRQACDFRHFARDYADLLSVHGG
ncbi:MAG: NAD(P)H-binding protein [Acidobacteriota bacterium]